MREIEFRGLTSWGKWVYGGIQVVSETLVSIEVLGVDGRTWVIPETVGMGVVIEDKRFFEGDRVVCSIIHSDTGKRFDDIEGVIKFDSNTASFIIENINNMRGFYFLHSAIINTIKVIGNIHEEHEKKTDREHYDKIVSETNFSDDGRRYKISGYLNPKVTLKTESYDRIKKIYPEEATEATCCGDCKLLHEPPLYSAMFGAPVGYCKLDDNVDITDLEQTPDDCPLLKEDYLITHKNRKKKDGDN